MTKEFSVATFKATPRFAVIEAGAGSGKTFNLVRIVRALGADPAACRGDISRVLLVTFTQAAALEMRQRMRALLEEDLARTDEGTDERARAARALTQLSRMQISTIHSFCYRAYAEYGPAAGFPPVEGEARDPQEIAEEIGADFWRLCLRGERSGPSYPAEAREAAKWLMAEPDCRLSKALEDSGIRDFVRRRTQLLEQGGGALTFDTVIQNFLAALRDPRRGETLKDSIRKDFDACLVDECQDTDARQFAIFQELFGEGSGKLLMMVGDRNQSIYGFRGADVENYKRAVAMAKAENRSTLSENNRSSAALVDLFNRLFRPGEEPCFFGPGEHIERIRVPDRPGEPLPPATKARLLDAPEGPLRLVRTSEEADVVAEVARLLAELARPVDPAGGGVKAAEFAAKLPSETTIGVLTRTTFRAKAFHQALVNHGIPAALATQSSVFTCALAPVLHHLLQAVLTPEDAGIRRTLFFAQPRVFGQAGALKALLEKHDTQLAAWLREVRATWEKEGFGRGWEKLVSDAPDGLRPMREALAEGPMGLRQLADLAHMGEILRGRSLKLKLTPEALVDHLADRINKTVEQEESEEEEHIRPETAEPQVVVRTMHTSKGLEYHGVVLPDIGGDELSEKHKGGLLRQEGQPLFISGSSEDEPFGRYGDQTIKDNARLLYVAITRAQRKLVILWGKPKEDNGARRVGFPVVLGQAGLGDNAEAFAAALEAEVAEAADLDASLAEAKPLLRRPKVIAAHREPPAVPFQPKGGTSFGDLSKVPEGADEDEPASPERPPKEMKREARDRREGDQPLPFLAFPKGKGPGVVLHTILEHARFDVGSPEAAKANAALILAELSESGIFLRRDKAETERLVKEQGALFASCLPRWLDTPLKGLGAPLSTLTPDRMMAEIRFGMRCKMGSTGAKAIAEAIAADYPEGSPLREIEVNPAAIEGLLVGVVDLVFEHGGKLHILDWKSNHLGDEAADYRGRALERGVLSHQYHLQYTIYAAALHRYMRAVDPTWDYEARFGGCHYLFLRAFGHAEEAGDHFHRPSLKTIEALLRNVDATFD